MTKKTLLGIFLLITTVCCFSSCEEDHYYIEDPYEIAMDNLCIPIWSDEYETNDGRECFQELEFNYDFTGREYRTYYYPNGRVESREDFPFRWKWDIGYTDALYIDYPDGTGVWLEEIRFGNNTMKCIYDDSEYTVTFKASYR